MNALWGGKEEPKEEKVAGNFGLGIGCSRTALCGTTKAKWTDFSSHEIKAMLERTTVLLKGLHACRRRSVTVCRTAGHPRISRLFLVMEAASNTEDMQIKLVALAKLGQLGLL